MDDALLAELVATPPDAFVARRNALVAELKAQGDKDAAAAVAKLRRPPREAWALNVAAREHPDVATEWAEAARAARDAQATGSADLRPALTRLRAATAAFVDAVGDRAPAGDAARLLAESAMSEEQADAVAAGTVGFGVAAPPRRRSRPAAKSTAPATAKQSGREPRASEPAAEPPARGTTRKTDDRLARARTVLKTARAEHTKAEREQSRAEAALDKAAKELADAQERLVAAQREHLAARRRLTAAQRLAREAAERVADAERKVGQLSN